MSLNWSFLAVSKWSISPGSKYYSILANNSPKNYPHVYDVNRACRLQCFTPFQGAVSADAVDRSGLAELVFFSNHLLSNIVITVLLPRLFLLIGHDLLGRIAFRRLICLSLPRLRLRIL